MKCPKCPKELHVSRDNVWRDSVLVGCVSCVCGFEGHLCLKAKWADRDDPYSKDQFEWSITNSEGLLRYETGT